MELARLTTSGISEQIMTSRRRSRCIISSGGTCVADLPATLSVRLPMVSRPCASAGALRRGDRPPAFVDRENGAAELRISPETWDRWEADGTLPASAPGLATCQRESDLIRMGPEHREGPGIWCRPKKTRKKRKAFNIPLEPAEARMLTRWAETPITFTASRWKRPIERHRRDLYLYSPRGAPYTTTSLQARWQRWLKRTERGRELCQRWQQWVTDMVRKYEWDIDPAEATNPTIHGLRGAGILIRRARGHDVDQIANDIGMSRQMVERYMRFRDQMQAAAQGLTRLRIIK
jgi:hypothetical protein